MTAITECPLPDESLLQTYRRSGGYTDCFAADIARAVTHAQFVEAFYTTNIFAVEQFLLGVFLSKPSNDAQARQLATGSIDNFAAWRVEARASNQLLLTDFTGRTRSWLMVAPHEVGADTLTRLYFGSAVGAVTNRKTGGKSMGSAFHALLGFHRLYSRILLSSARAKLQAGLNPP